VRPALLRDQISLTRKEGFNNSGCEALSKSKEKIDFPQAG
jgi:hypothetical protein